MKNYIKKMKYSIVGLGLILGLGLGLGLRADIKYFWLDHPTGRTNPNDPMSPFYSSPTPKRTLAPATSGTPTNTPTATPTYSASPTITFSPTDTPQQTPTNTPTNTPSPTVSPTAGWPTVYGYNASGEYVPLTTSSGTNFVNNSAGYAAASEVSGAGPGTDASYAALSLSCSAGLYSAAGEFTTGYTSGGANQPENATAFSSLSISVELVNNNDVPAVALVTDAGGVTKVSQVVSAGPYMLGGAQFMATGTWYTCVIPLSVFTYGEDGTGWNGQASANSDTITAADMAAVVGVEVLPTTYDMSPVAGSPNPPPAAGKLPLTTYNVDDINFVNTTGPTLSSNLAPGQAAFGQTAMFCDFEHGAQSNWGGYWSTFNDGDADDAAAPTTGDSGICTGAGSVSTRTFPVCTNCPVTGAPSLATINPPVDGAEGSGTSGNAPTPSNFGHFAGTIGSEANGIDCTNANPSGIYSFWGMGVYFLPTNATANVLKILQVGQATAGCTGCSVPAYGTNPRPLGIQLDIKAGPGDSNCPTNCEKYYLALAYNAQPDSNGPAAELIPTTSWQTVQIPFPTPGATGTTVTMPAGGPGGGTYGQNEFTMASWDTAHATAGATPVPWDYSGTSTDILENLLQLKIQADNRGVPVDLEVDNIAFYYAPGTLLTPALRRGFFKVR